MNTLKRVRHAFYLNRIARRIEAAQGVTGASLELRRLARVRTDEEGAAAHDRQMARDPSVYEKMGLYRSLEEFVRRSHVAPAIGRWL